jgi:DNA-binding transcriptional MerR regulator
VKTRDLLRTSEILRMTGITHQVLYRYITAGLIEPVHVTKTGQRFFRTETINLIEIIKDFNQKGYLLRDLKDTYFQDKNVKRLLEKRTSERNPPEDDRTPPAAPVTGETAAPR